MDDGLERPGYCGLEVQQPSDLQAYDTNGPSLNVTWRPNNTTALRWFYQVENGDLCALDFDPSYGTLIDGIYNFGASYFFQRIPVPLTF